MHRMGRSKFGSFVCTEWTGLNLAISQRAQNTDQYRNEWLKSQQWYPSYSVEGQGMGWGRGRWGLGWERACWLGA